MLARETDVICLSTAVEKEIRAVFARPKFRKYLTDERIAIVLGLLTAAALIVEPAETVTDCRDTADNKYLELALASGATMIIASDDDLLCLDPWRGIRIITPADYLSERSDRGR